MACVWFQLSLQIICKLWKWCQFHTIRILRAFKGPIIMYFNQPLRYLRDYYIHFNVLINIYGQLRSMMFFLMKILPYVTRKTMLGSFFSLWQFRMFVSAETFEDLVKFKSKQNHNKKFVSVKLFDTSSSGYNKIKINIDYVL